MTHDDRLDRGTEVSTRRPFLSRRDFLGAASAIAVGAPIGVISAKALPVAGPGTAVPAFPLCAPAAAQETLAGPAHKFSIAWNANSICLSPVAVAVEKGIFAKHNLDPELVNFSGSTDQLLEALATGKSDAGVGMALRWLKALEQGFDVKITAGTHGGCMRVLARADSGIKSITDLKGKSIGVSDMAAPDKNFFSILLQKRGVDPVKEVEWRQYPGDLLRLAAEKGEVDAFTAGDPNAYLWLKDGTFKEVASNLDAEYANRTCCILGIRGSLIRDQPQVAGAITRALLEAASYAVANPLETAKVFKTYAPKASLDDLATLVRYHTHHHHPVGDALKTELKAYADELKLVSVFKPTTDTTKFANRIYADVLGV